MNQRPDHLAREATEAFIAENSRSKKAADAARAKAAEASAEGSATAH